MAVGRYLESKQREDSEDESDDARCEQELLRELSELGLAAEEQPSFFALLWRGLFAGEADDDRATPLVER